MAQPAHAVKSGTESGSLVPQPHGGALRHGSLPGNTGGSGRPPSIVRDAARAAWFDRIPILTAIADGDAIQKVKLPDGTETGALVSAEPGERIRALAELSKVGMGSAVTMDDIRERLAEQVQVIRAALPKDAADLLLKQLGEVWR